MKLNIKQKLAGAKDFAKKHKNSVIGTTIVVAGTAALVLIYAKNHKAALARRAELEAAGKKILSTFGNSETIEGSGPIWDALKELFSGVDMQAEDIWMIEAGDAGEKIISFIGDGPMEQLTVTQF